MDTKALNRYLLAEVDVVSSRKFEWACTKIKAALPNKAPADAGVFLVRPPPRAVAPR